MIRKADPALLAVILDMPRCEVTAYIGRDNAVRLTGSQTPELVLLDGAAQTYKTWLERQGYSPSTATLHVTQVLSDVAAGLFSADH
jgi:hypothetical protein